MHDRLFEKCWGMKVSTRCQCDTISSCNCCSVCRWRIMNVFAFVCILYTLTHYFSLSVHCMRNGFIVEFCMQIDAATDFIQGWDTIAVKQWIKTGNEYAILSNEPLSSKEREKNGGESVEVPRHCSIKIGSEGVPVSYNILFDADLFHYKEYI